MSWPSPELELEQAAAPALASILLELWRFLKSQEEGVWQGSDPEALHDFRVAVRRGRVLLGELRKVFPKSARAYRRELAWLGRSTGRARDLDVFLEELAVRPPSDYGGGDRAMLHRALSDLRREAREPMLRALGSERYLALRESWPVYLKSRQSGSKTEGFRTLGERVGRRIARRLDRFEARGRAITASSAAEELHRLRIEGKKLRYLLEAFRTLYSPAAVEGMIFELKQAQSHLGRLNDRAVQLRLLAELVDVERLSPAEVGDLPRQLLAERQQAQGEFVRVFEAFGAAGFHELFGSRFPSAGRDGALNRI